jgi:hypothetical protein
VSEFYVGVDLGQRQDYTALAVVEHLTRPAQWRPWWGKTRSAFDFPDEDEADLEAETPEEALYVVRQLDRVRDTSYEAVIDTILGLFRYRELRSAALVVDATGVGVPVLDAMRRRGLKPYAITITGGTSVHQDGQSFHTPKKDLVAAVAVLLESHRLQIVPSLKHAPTLSAELQNFKAKLTPAGHETFGAGAAPDWRQGAHDDLVLATATALWLSERIGRTRGHFGPHSVTAAERVLPETF